MPLTSLRHCTRQQLKLIAMELLFKRRPVYCFYCTGTPDIRISAICYFAAAILVLLLAFVTFFLLRTIVCLLLSILPVPLHSKICYYKQL